MTVPTVMMVLGGIIIALGLFRYMMADSNRPATLETLRGSIKGLVIALFGISLLLGGYILQASVNSLGR